jgi:hypothetical protein
MVIPAGMRRLRWTPRPSASWDIDLWTSSRGSWNRCRLVL